MNYILCKKPDGCIFCHAATATGEDEANLVLYRATHNFVIMNRYPYTHGHLMVVPYQHADRLEQLSSDVQTELMTLWIRAQSIVRHTFSPQGINLGMNLGQAAGAGIEAHLHAHIVPRWNGDTNFMPMLADTRVMPEHLDATYKKLKLEFEKL
jgi:ATP adenylyltransferase